MSENVEVQARDDGWLLAQCQVCREFTTQPDKGMGRAALAAWKTRHQHLEAE